MMMHVEHIISIVKLNFRLHIFVITGDAYTLAKGTITVAGQAAGAIAIAEDRDDK